MVVLITCNNKEDPIKMKALGCSQHYISIFFRRARAGNSGFSGDIWPKFEHNIFPIITLWQLSVAMEPEFQSYLVLNLKCLWLR